MNSIADNQNVGDERIFTIFKDSEWFREDGHWQRSGELAAGKTYAFRMYLNASGADYEKTADLHGVVAHLRLPDQVGGSPNPNSAGTSQYCGFFTSSNANPNQIWSCGALLAKEGVRLFPDPSSVELYNNHFGAKTRGPLNLGPSILTSKGQLLGFDRMDGVVPSGYYYDLYLYIEVKVERI